MKLENLIWIHKFFVCAGLCAMFFHGMTHAYAIHKVQDDAQMEFIRMLPVKALTEIPILEPKKDDI